MYDDWERLRQRGSGWYLMGHTLRGGDLYHVCTLIPHFARTHGAKHPIYLALNNDRQASIASMFAEHFRDVIVTPGFPETREAWTQFYGATGLPTFGLDVPIVLHPQVNVETTRFSTDFLDENRHFGLTWMQLHKQVMHLPGEVEPRHPVRRAEPARLAEALCRESGVPQGTGVILFPYAQSLPVESIDHFARLARAFAAQGRTVFTSVALDEQPVPGTRPISIPFALLPDVAEYAGWVVAVRSGICDILSPVPCRKSFIYPDLRELRFWSIAALGLGRDAAEFPFDFRRGTAERLTEHVLGGTSFDRLPAVRDHLSRRIGERQIGTSVTTLSFVDLARDPNSYLQGLPRVEAASVLRLLDVPPRAHPRQAPQITAALSALLDRIAGPAVRFYACRDAMIADAFEEIGRDALIGGDYVAAGFDHSIVAVRGTTLAALLPPDLNDAVVTRAAAVTGAPIPLSDAFHARIGRHAEAVRPIEYRGLRLGEGWCNLEPWGVWSEGGRSTVSFTLPAAPRRPVRVMIDVAACTSPDFPLLRFAVRANGTLVSRHEIGGAPSQLALQIPADAFRDASCTLAFEFSEVRSPEQQGRSGDRRMLGLALHSVRITP